MRMRYRTQTVYAQLNVLDSHDVSRFLSLCGENRDKYKLAIVFQMCFPGMPSVFYGDELGVTGVLEDEYRQPMPWGREDTLHNFFRELIQLRRRELALTEGDYHALLAGENSGLYVFSRKKEDEEIKVFLNMGEKCDVSRYTDGQKVLLAENFENGTLFRYGYAILKSQNR